MPIVQPSAATPRSIQRDVGFEFQSVKTNTGFFRDEERFKDPKAEYYEYKSGGEGYRLGNDNGDLEFDTDPFPETKQGYQDLRMTLVHMEMVSERLSQMGQTPLSAVNPRASVLIEPKEDFEGKEDVVLNADTPIVADPQTTIGVKLDQLFRMAELFAGGKERHPSFIKSSSSGKVVPSKKGRDRYDSRDSRVSPRYMQWDDQQLASYIGWKAFGSTQEKVLQPAVKAVASIPDISASLRGFLFVIAHYIFGMTSYAIGGKSAAPYAAKYATPMMSRSSLADVFVQLPEEDQLYFAKNAQRIVKEVFEVAPDSPLFPKGMEWEFFKGSFTIAEWLDALVPKFVGKTGVDLTSLYRGLGDVSSMDPAELAKGVGEEKFSEIDVMPGDDFVGVKSKSRAAFLKGMGGVPTHIGSTETDEVRADGIVLEMRKLANKIAPSEWLPFASSVFELMVLLNQGPEARAEIMGVNDLD